MLPKKTLSMGKINYSAGISVFGQLINLIPRKSIAAAIIEHKSDSYTKWFKTWDHLVTVLFAALSDCTSLREIESAIAGYHSKLLHLGLKSIPKGSTLSDANAKRSADVFEAIFKKIYDQLKGVLPDSYPKNQKWMQKLFLVDSTSITLFKDIMKACGNAAANGKKKGGVKIHVGMQLSENVPSLVCITNAATNDRKFMVKFKDMQPQTVLVFDKAYVNFELYNHWTRTDVTFVTRLHGNCVIEEIEKKEGSEEQQEQGIMEEKIVHIGHAARKEKVKCRLIRFQDKAKNRELLFLTNDFKMQASRIAEIYKQRWQIELLFKRLKQNLQLSSFLGDNENAIRIQIWCNLIADLLLTVIRKGLARKMAYSNVAALIRIHLLNYVQVKDLLLNPADSSIFTSNKFPSHPSLNFAAPP